MVKQIASIKPSKRRTANRTPVSGRNGNGAKPTTEVPPAPPAALLSAEMLKLLRQMRVNPLPRLDPQMLGITLDQFDYGILRQAVLLWEAMAARDDTLIAVKPQLENDVASQDWGVFQVDGVDEKESARHKAALDYFYDHMSATDAYDRNERGGRDKFIEQMMRAESFKYAVHHFVWKPTGKMVPVKIKDSKGQDVALEAVPALTAEMEYVPLWFFENTTGRLRFLKDGGFSIEGEELNWDGEWMVTTGRCLMFPASICYTFKRLTFQDWTVFNERYAQNKVVGQTPAAKNSDQGKAMKSVVENFNSDQGIVIYESQTPDKSPVTLLGPSGTAAVETFMKFIERQDAKMSAMYRGNDLSMQSRGEYNERRIGASLQEKEGNSMLRGACRRIAGVCQEFIDRQVIKFCFGPDVEPLAYFGLPDLDLEDTEDIRASAEFLANHGIKVDGSDVAERLGIRLVGQDNDVLQPMIKTAAPDPNAPRDPSATPNASNDPDLEKFLGEHRGPFLVAMKNDLTPLRLAIEHVIATPNQDLQFANLRALRSQLPFIAKEMVRNPRSGAALVDLVSQALHQGIEMSRKEIRQR